MTVKTKNSLAQQTLLKIEFEYPIQNISLLHIGVDPGNKNLGVAVLDIPTKKGEVFQAILYQITFSQRALDALGRVKSTSELLNNMYFPKYPKSVVIENAAFGELYRQVELEDIRVGVGLWFECHNAKVQLLSPQTIRKNAFGSGKIKAHEYWECLSKYPDAAAALSCAVCCLT